MIIKKNKENCIEEKFFEFLFQFYDVVSVHKLTDIIRWIDKQSSYEHLVIFISL
jgi:hypothetical protein